MRPLTVGAAQLGPIARYETRASVVKRLIALLHQVAERGCDVVVFPELALTTFFPRWFFPDDSPELASYFETEMPSAETQPLFDEAKRLGIGFHLGYAELTPDGHRFNTAILVDRDGTLVAKYRKVHIPGHEEHEPQRPFQHLERRYFEESAEGFNVCGRSAASWHRAVQRPPLAETYRVMGLQGVEMIFIGYNTPLHYAPDPVQEPAPGLPQSPRDAGRRLPERHLGGGGR